MRNILLVYFILASMVGLEHAVAKTPTFPSVEGYELRQTEPVYTPANLWELIDGAADLFVSYDLKDMQAAEYWSKDSTDVRVELYRYTRPENAFGVYSQERDPGFAFLNIGTQGYIEDGLLNFLCGHFYVKVSTHRPGPQGKEAMLSVSRAMVEHLKQPSSWPAMVGLLPQQGRLANSEAFVLENFLGYSFMRAGWLARYGADARTQVFVLDCETSDKAQAVLRRYFQVVRSAEVAGDQREYELRDPNHGEITLVVRDRFLGGIVRAAEGEPREVIRQELRDNLSKAAGLR